MYFVVVEKAWEGFQKGFSEAGVDHGLCKHLLRLSFSRFVFRTVRA